MVSSIETIGLVSGGFNLFHPGHGWLLEQARGMCDILIVAVGSDYLIMKQKKRPLIVDEQQRLYMVKNFKGVDEAILEDPKDPPKNLKRIVDKYKPDYYFTSSDSPNTEKYKALFKKHGTKIVRLDRYNNGIYNISTSEIIRRIKNAKN